MRKKLFSPALVLAAFALDRLSKVCALGALPGRPLAPLPFLRLTYAENTGVAFGMFNGMNLFFMGLSAAMVAVLLVLRRRISANGRLAEAGLALVIGGALGNLYDRISYGFVVDFIDLTFFPAVFNVADSCITVGAALMALGIKDKPEGAKRRA